MGSEMFIRASFPYKGEDGKSLPNVVLDLDLTVLIPRR